MVILITTLGLLFVIEGILPFLSPSLLRWIIHHTLLQSDRSLRIMGLVSMLFGLTLVSLAKDLY